MNAKLRLDKLKKDLEQLDKDIMTTSRKPTVGPGGKNIFEEQYVDLAARWPRSRCGSASYQQLLIAEIFPKPDFSSAAGSREQRIALLSCRRRNLH